MITLAMDTSYKNLVLCLFDGDKILGSFCATAFKKQSETIFVELEKLLETCHLKLKDIEAVVITKGPGSYTGLRIAMTIAKVLAAESQCKLYVINSLQLYAGMDDHANVLMDARGHRAYAAHIEKGKTKWMGILDVDDIPSFLEEHPGTLYGDGYLAGLEAAQSDFVNNFAALSSQYELVENVHALVPEYLKESDSYKV